MKHLRHVLCGLLLLAAASAFGATVQINNAFLGCVQPRKVAIDASGGVWFPCQGVITKLLYFPGIYGAILPPAIAIDSIPLPAGVQANALAFDNSNNVWFTDFLGNRVGKADLATKLVTLYPMPTAGAEPEGIVFASDGNIYVSTFGSGRLYRISSSGVMTSLTSVPAGHHIRGLAATSGPLLVFGDFDTCSIYEYSPLFDISILIPTTCQKIYDVTIGPDGLVWYAGGTKIGKLAAAGPIAYDPAPGTIAVAIAAAPDGTLWYGGDSGLVTSQTKLGQITTGGVALDAPVPPGTSTAAYVAVRASDGTVFFTLPGNDKYGFVLPAVAMAPDATVVEFHSATGDHYFITASADETNKLDTGVIPGWTRTGQTFKAWAAIDAPIPNADPVCRFLGQLGSHFFSASAAECQAVITLFGNAWLLESLNVFEVVLPGTIDGSCPSGTVPVYRLYSNRPDGEHRYTTSLAIWSQMVAAGWLPEGYGVIGAVMCVPT
jgi:virginiamycin B lyase